MKVETLAEKMVKKMIKFYPRVNRARMSKLFLSAGEYKKQLKEKLVKRLKNFPGIKRDMVETVPKRLEVDEDMLKFRIGIYNELIKIKDEEPDSHIWTGSILTEKELGRLFCIMSSKLEPTYFGGKNLTQVLPMQFVKEFDDFVNYYDDIGFMPGVFIPKRKDSSNGLNLRNQDMEEFQLVVRDILDIIKNEKELLYNNDYYVALITRNMPKNNFKDRVVADEDGKPKIHNRELREPAVDYIKNYRDPEVMNTPWHSGQHRAVCLKEEIEHVKRLFMVGYIEAAKHIYCFAMKYKPNIMAIMYNAGYKYILGSDATMYDQSVAEHLMKSIYKKYSSINKVLDLHKIRERDNMVWYNEKKDEMVNLRDLVDESLALRRLDMDKLLNEGLITKEQYTEAQEFLDILSSYKYIAGIDSGNAFVSHNGKDPMIFNYYYIFKHYMGLNISRNKFLENFFELDYEVAKSTMKEKGLAHLFNTSDKGSCRVWLQNSSDDHVNGFTKSWARETLKNLLMWSLDEHIRPWILTEPDSAYLSRTLAFKHGKVIECGIASRLVANSMVKEYTNRKENGKFKDLNVSYGDWLEKVLETPNGEDIIKIYDKVTKKVFNKDTFMGFISDSIKNVDVEKPSSNIGTEVNYMDLSAAEKKLYDDKSKQFYRDDLMEEASDEFKMILATHISPLDTYFAYAENGELDHLKTQILIFKNKIIEVYQGYVDRCSEGIIPQEMLDVYKIDKKLKMWKEFDLDQHITTLYKQEVAIGKNPAQDLSVLL